MYCTFSAHTSAAGIEELALDAGCWMLEEKAMNTMVASHLISP